MGLTLSRPERRNAMSARMVRELSAAAAAAASGVRVVVIRGEGDHFCSGGDVADMAEAARAPSVHGDPIADMNRSFGSMLEAFAALPAAIVVVAEGSVMGGGAGLVAVADVVLASTDVKLRLPETSLGVTPAQILPFLLARVGQRAVEWALTGRVITADEGLRCGLFHRTVEPMALDGALADTLDGLRRAEPSAVRETKALVGRFVGRPSSGALDEAAQGFARLARSEAALEGMTAMLARRKPTWAED